MNASIPVPAPIAGDDRYMLDACFLGPYGENDTLLEKLMVEFLRDHVYWRRNFHPEDPPAIPTDAAQHPDYRAFEARMRRELHLLSAALKKSVPFHSPRYLGHMVSDLLLPGLAAQMLTLPYNPNNVTEEAAPVTVDMEVQVGLQLARMLGYPHDPAQPACAFGHLTSGGTLANYQALRLALALKAFPVALRAAGVPELTLPEDDWSAFNMPADATIALLDGWQHWIVALSPLERARWRQRVEDERIEQRGLAGFFATHPQLRVPRVLAPVTAHYSWSKGLKLLGLGRDQLELLPTEGMRLDPAALRDTLQRYARERQPVLMCVAVLGSTEYGTIDPVDQVLAARTKSRQRGLDFSVHVDAAWGGYLATVFRNEDGTLRTRDEVAADYEHFPTPAVHAAFAAVGDTDSVTVDPHKLGYLPYGSGAFVCRDHRAMALLAERADYVFHDVTPAAYLARYRSLGQFIPEGSKSGAAAAAVYVTHKVLPLDHAHFGRLPRATVRTAEVFHARVQRFAQELAGEVHALVPFAPDSNLVCIALNPRGNTSVTAANAFVRELYDSLRADPTQPLQTREFFGSITSLRPHMLGAPQTARILDTLGLDPASFAAGDERLLILRHTLMNPHQIDRENGISYIDRYFEFLARRVRAACGVRMKSVALTDSIYEAAFVPERWPKVLNALCKISGSASSTLMLADGRTPPRWQTTARTRGLLERLSHTDVWKRPERSPDRLIAASVDDQYFHCVDDLLTRRQLELDPIYQAYKTEGLAWQVGTAIVLPSDTAIILTFERNIAQGRHSAEQLAQLAGVRAHLARAGLVANRLGLERARGALEAMTAIGIPAALLDQQGHLREANRWMTAGLIGTRGGRRVVLGDRAGDALLDNILRGESDIRSIPLPPNQRAPGRVAHIIPLTGAARDIFSGGISLIVMNVSGASHRRPDLAILRALFDLSPAESRLAAELATAATLEDAALHCHIQPSTARAYLEQIFHKTGCHRQAELVGLLTGLIYVAPDSDREHQPSP